MNIAVDQHRLVNAVAQLGKQFRRGAGVFARVAGRYTRQQVIHRVVSAEISGWSLCKSTRLEPPPIAIR